MTISEVAKRFGITNDESKQAIDALSPELIVRGQEERCICSTSRRTAWTITKDRHKIDAYIKQSGMVGREYGVVLNEDRGKLLGAFGVPSNPVLW